MYTNKSHFQDYEIENKQLRETLEEYNSEFAEVKNQGISTLHMQSCLLSEWELFFAHFVWFSCLLFRGDYKQTKGKTARVWGQDGRKSSGLKN